MADPWTPVPNWLIEAMPDMSQSTLGIALVVARQTLGYRKEWDTISISQFMEATGMSRPTVVTAIESGAGRWFERRQRGNSFEYQLVKFLNQNGKEILPVDEPASKEILPESVKKFNQNGKEIEHTKEERKKTTTTSDGDKPSPPRHETDSGFAEAYALVQKNFPGTYSADSLDSDILGDMVDEHGAEKTCAAIRIAVEQNVRRLSYVRGTLTRWATGESTYYANGAAPNAAKGVIVPTEEGAAW